MLHLLFLIKFKMISFQKLKTKKLKLSFLLENLEEKVLEDEFLKFLEILKTKKELKHE